jgi:transposase
MAARETEETAHSMPITIGADAHKKTHTMVSLDAVGRRLGEMTVPTSTDGHAGRGAVRGAVRRRRRRGGALRGRGLPALTADWRVTCCAPASVVRVHTRLMADARRGVRRPGKSDPIDAEAVALAALREPDLPVAQLDGPAREVKLLVDTRGPRRPVLPIANEVAPGQLRVREA